MPELDTPRDSNGMIIDFLEGIPLPPTPEEFVRQRFLRILHEEYGYGKELMRRELPIRHGRRDMVDQTGHPIRADIVVYTSAAARVNLSLIHISEPTRLGMISYAV